MTISHRHTISPIPTFILIDERQARIIKDGATKSTLRCDLDWTLGRSALSLAHNAWPVLALGGKFVILTDKGLPVLRHVETGSAVALARNQFALDELAVALFQARYAAQPAAEPDKTLNICTLRGGALIVKRWRTAALKTAQGVKARRIAAVPLFPAPLSAPKVRRLSQRPAGKLFAAALGVRWANSLAAQREANRGALLALTEAVRGGSDIHTADLPAAAAAARLNDQALGQARRISPTRTRSEILTTTCAPRLVMAAPELVSTGGAEAQISVTVPEVTPTGGVEARTDATVPAPPVAPIRSKPVEDGATFDPAAHGPAIWALQGLKFNEVEMLKARHFKGRTAAALAKLLNLKVEAVSDVLNPPPVIAAPVELLGQGVGGTVWTRRVLYIWERQGGGWTFNSKQAKPSASIHHYPADTLLRVLALTASCAVIHDPLRHFVIHLDTASAHNLLEA